MEFYQKLAALIISAVLGSVTGYLLDHNARIQNGEEIEFNKWKLASYLILGLMAAFVSFFLMTQGREVRASDYVISSLAAMKGAEWLQKAGDGITGKK